MVAQVDIYNLALDAVGHTETLSSVDDKLKAAYVCNRHYDIALAATLRDFPWGFANRAVALAEVTGASYPGWVYAYGYPADCLAAHQVCDSAGIRLRWYDWVPGFTYVQWVAPKVPFQVVSSATDGKLIVTDLQYAYLIYTARVTDTSQFDELFITALSRRLAYEIIVPLSVDPKKTQGVWNAYEAALTQAKAADLREAQPDPPPESPSISGRY